MTRYSDDLDRFLGDEVWRSRDAKFREDLNFIAKRLNVSTEAVIDVVRRRRIYVDEDLNPLWTHDAPLGLSDSEVADWAVKILRGDEAKGDTPS